MNEQVSDLTPPTHKKNGKASAKPAKEPKAAKPEATPKDPNAPKKARAPRTDYGFAPTSVINLVEGADVAKYRGARLDWYNRLKAAAGQTVQQFLDANQGVVNGKGQSEPPRGWLRFFVQDGAASLSKPS